MTISGERKRKRKKKKKKKKSYLKAKQRLYVDTIVFFFLFCSTLSVLYSTVFSQTVCVASLFFFFLRVKNVQSEGEICENNNEKKVAIKKKKKTENKHRCTKAVKVSAKDLN